MLLQVGIKHKSCISECRWRYGVLAWIEIHIHVQFHRWIAVYGTHTWDRHGWQVQEKLVKKNGGSNDYLPTKRERKNADNDS